jgi:hypothetical protein
VFVTSEGDTVAFGTIVSCRHCGPVEIIRKLTALVDPDELKRQAGDRANARWRKVRS